MANALVAIVQSLASALGKCQFVVDLPQKSSSQFGVTAPACNTGHSVHRTLCPQEVSWSLEEVSDTRVMRVFTQHAEPGEKLSHG